MDDDSTLFIGQRATPSLPYLVDGLLVGDQYGLTEELHGQY